MKSTSSDTTQDGCNFVFEQVSSPLCFCCKQVKLIEKRTDEQTSAVNPNSF
jgi:hypothetical protein